MNKKGIVMEVDKNKVGILTSSGEFIYVTNSITPPELGQIYESQEIKLKSSTYKNIKKFSLIAASLVIIFICSIFIKTYNVPVASVIIKINPSIKLQTNKWNKVINITPLNEDGTNLIKSLNLENKTLEKGIILILKEAKKQNYINSDYKNSSKVISLNLTGNTSNFKLGDIENELKNLKVKYIIKSPQGTNTNYNNNIKPNDNKNPVTNNKTIKPNDKNNSSTDEIKSKNSDSKIKKYNEHKGTDISSKANNNSSNKNIPKTNENNIKENSNNKYTKNLNNMKNDTNNKELKKDIKKNSSSINKNEKTIKNKTENQR